MNFISYILVGKDEGQPMSSNSYSKQLQFSPIDHTTFCQSGVFRNPTTVENHLHSETTMDCTSSTVEKSRKLSQFSQFRDDSPTPLSEMEDPICSPPSSSFLLTKTGYSNHDSYLNLIFSFPNFALI